ncbi:MAG: peptidoglycan-binding protein [Lachnospiraceae bacterium]|nr:peptidoglycan-binding protein [Lachnospiraceae bacterium]
MKIIKKLLIMLLCAGLLLSAPTSYAHPGEGHHGGGHHNNNLDEHDYNHYYCGGNPAHLHQNGICPYASSSGTYNQKDTKKPNTSANNNASKIRKIQKKLNKLGYKCGKADGICDKKTRKAIKKYQDENNLKANGKINKTLCRKLNIN